MKIERLNENQIRCTLNKSDLASRQLKINELAYGSDKAKELFRDMMQQASYELGFEAEDTPLMIEAIPVSSECIVLIVTKVDNPEELDTRFSRFSPSDSDDDNFDFDDIETIEGNDYSVLKNISIKILTIKHPRPLLPNSLTKELRTSLSTGNLLIYHGYFHFLHLMI